MEELKDVGGLYNVNHGSKAQFPSVQENKFIQVIHDGDKHWLLAIYGFFNYREVTIFDSAYHDESLKPFVIASLASLLKTEKKEIRISVAPCQQQKNSYDCGVFAIAFAWAILAGKDPLEYCFNAKDLRPHLQRCLENRKLTPFKLNKSKNINRGIEINKLYEVYCSCRRPAEIWSDHRDKMAECEQCLEWFHAICEKIPKNIEEISWLCSQCSSSTAWYQPNTIEPLRLDLSSD